MGKASKDRSFSVPGSAEVPRLLRSPQQMRSGDEPFRGAWTKVQQELLDFAYLDCVDAFEFRFMSILYDQLFRHGNGPKDQRRYVLASFAQLEGALHLSNNKVRRVAESLRGKGLIKFDEVTRGLFRFSPIYLDEWPKGSLRVSTADAQKGANEFFQPFIVAWHTAALAEGFLWIPYGCSEPLLLRLLIMYQNPPADGDGRTQPLEALLSGFGRIIHPVPDNPEEKLPRWMRQMIHDQGAGM